MTKQEKIMEGIERFLIAEAAEPIYPKKLAKLIMQYLHDNDAVLKVERELPKLLQKQGPHKAFAEKDLQRRLLKSGGGFFEPLIGGVSDEKTEGK